MQNKTKQKKKTYFIKVFGCQFNKADAEKIAKFLDKKNYKQSPSFKRADLIVILMCSVRQKSVDKVISVISNCKSQIANINLKSKISKQPKIILKGCILRDDKKVFKEMGCEFSFPGLSKRQIEKEKPLSGLIEIGQGCNNFCSYCVVPHTRGRERYRNPKNILCEARYLIKKGIKEITLIAQNVNSYKYRKTDFADLLKMVNNIKGDFKIRFLTNHPKDVSDKLIKAIAKLPKVKKEIHLPFQAGSTTILKKMNRKYSKRQYLRLVEKIKRQIPDVVLTTDVIVGFPGETKKQFQETAEVIKKVGFKQIFIGKYSSRSGTAAYNLKDNVPLEEKKRREQTLLKILKK